MNKSNIRIAAGIALSVLATMIVFWWFVNYSTLSLADMIGTMVVVYFGGLYITAVYVDKKKKNERKRLKKMKREEAIDVFKRVAPLMDKIQEILLDTTDGDKYNFSLSVNFARISCTLDDGYKCECSSWQDKPYVIDITRSFGLKDGGDNV